ncbi:hypothetical protein PHET_05757 [Paragonimus heterotremus]|uniref:[Histone H3]-lysine(4) N-trimethyltransferase n=1 Tax=Paragonimus heterotremus TaxID=100268 RepID=A0A8J4SP42_9TREM|nr:hypothetical protein PHET_05757 [Paragonimus heterotremus]
MNELPSLPEAQEPTSESSVLREYNTAQVQPVDKQSSKSPEKRTGKRITRSHEPQLNEAENVQLASDITKEMVHTPSKDIPTSHESVPVPESISSPVVSEKENVCDALPTVNFSQPESSEHDLESTAVPSQTQVLSSIPRIPVCRYCERTQDSKMIRKACTSCNALIVAFIRKLTRLDDCTCLRDLPCPSRWTLEWVPSADLVSRSKEKVLFQRYGPVLEDWCDPCKFTHYIRLGCRLSDYLWKTIPNYQILKSLNIDRLDDPVFQHRGRERRVEQYLRLLVEDFNSSRLSVRSTLENDESSNVLVHPFGSLFARFLDALWVRPLHLPSLAQLVICESCPLEGSIAEMHCAPKCFNEHERSTVNVVVKHSDLPTLNNECTESAPPESSIITSSSQEVDPELQPSSSSFVPTLAELCYQSGAPRPVNLMDVSSSVPDETSYGSQDDVSSIVRSRTPLSLAVSAPDASDLTGLQPTSSSQVSCTPENNYAAPNFSEALATLRYSPFTDIQSRSPDSSPPCPVKEHDAHMCKVEENLLSQTTPQPAAEMTESFRPPVYPVASTDREPEPASGWQENVPLDAGYQTISNSSTLATTHGTTIEPVEPCSLCVFRSATCQRRATQTIRNELARKLLRYSQYAITLGPVKVNSRSRFDSRHIPSALPDEVSNEELSITDACKQVSTVDKQTAADQAYSESCTVRETVNPEQVVLTTTLQAELPSSGLHEPNLPDPQDDVVMEVVAADRDLSSLCHVDSTVALPSEPVAVNVDAQTSPETNNHTVSSAAGSSDLPEIFRSSLSVNQRTEDAEVEALVHQNSTGNKTEPDTSIALPSILTSPDAKHKSKIESQTQSLSICGPCLLHLRSAAVNFITVVSAQFTDCLAELMRQPNRFCSHPRPVGHIQQSCLESLDGKLCERCCLYKSLLHIFQTLRLESDLTDTGVSMEGAPSNRQGEFVLPVGGPLLLPPRAIDQIKPNSFYDCRIAPKWPTLDPDGPDSNSASICLCCCTRCDLLSHYVVGSADQQICSGCLWTYKAAMLSASIDPRVLRIANRLASAAAATDHALPLLSLASRRTLVDTARLACMLSIPCTAGCVTSAKPAEPAWLTCPACTIRRCHRLLQSTLPYHAPRWYRRRVKLLAKSKLLEDLDPRLMWLLLERTNTLNSPDSSKNTHHRLSLVHVEYTTSVIERWLLPPELPASTTQEHENCDYSASSSEDESQVAEDVFSNDSSGFSTDSTPFTVSEQESEYGGKAWWDGQEFVDEPTKTTTVIEPEQDSSATEPETDPVRAEELTISYTTNKRNRKPSLKATEAVADSIVRKSARSVPKSSLLKEETQVDAVCEPVEVISGMPDHPSDCTTTEVVQDIHNEVAVNEEDSLQPQAECSVVTIKTPEKPDSSTMTVQNEVDTVTSTPRLAPRNQTNKRKSDQTEELIIRGKRRLKMNHRFLDDYDGNLPSLTGRDRRFRDDSGTSRDSNASSVSSRASGTSVLSRKTSSCSRASLLAQKRAHARLNQRDRSALMGVSSKLERLSSKQTRGSTSGEPKNHEVSKATDVASRSSGLGPRVKQISRPGLKPDETRFASTLSAMVQAARLAAVGAKIPGGTSPNHAALAVTARATATDGDDDEDDDLESNASDVEPSSLHIRPDQSKPPVTATGSVRSLLDRCGQCPACCGVIQPCGRCTNCRLLRKFGKHYPDGNARPCRELICFRRRPTRTGSNSGPRVKLPSNFPSPGSTGLNTPSYTQKNHSGHSDLTITPTTISSSRRDAFSPNCRMGTSMGSGSEGRDKHQLDDSNSVSLFHTIPGLAPQLEIDTWLGQSSNNNHDPNVACIHPRDYFRSTKPVDNVNVRSDVTVTPIPGGDLGMRFCSSKQPDGLDTDQDRIRPIEGEVVTSELAHHGGYAVVTTMAAAPPKEICYACGSGGGQLLFCVSCAEPFHFYCVERQFRPRRKDHFICRNCTECRHCRQPAADLRCTRCSGGYHPSCLSDYAPAQSGHRGNWVCPHCTSCIHCGAKPFTRLPDSSGSEVTQSTDGSSNSPHLLVSWSTESSKCAACNQAEARGDICPECERAYLPSTKQMIQCDTCHLWMHRTCTKLTADEYEWIARLPAGQLNKFVVNCTVCQSEQKQQALSATSNGTVGQDPINPSNDQLTSDVVTNGAGRLRTLARDTLMERMAGLVASCRRPVDPLEPTASSSSPSEASSPNGLLSSKTPHTYSSSVFPTRKLSDKVDSSRNRRIPQVDGTFDDDLKEESMDRRRRRISVDSPLYKPASDALFYEHADLHSPPSSSPSSSSFASGYPLAHPDSNMKQASGWSSSYSCKPTGFKRLDLTDTERPAFIRSHEEPHENRSRYHSGSSTSQSNRIPQPLIAPPTTAAWVTENESEHIWTSPRSLIYRLLTRILHRLSAHPINSSYANALRRLLRWLMIATESYFPWLNISEMANDVRDVLRQANGEFGAVWRHFEKCSLIEIHELICPVVARLSDLHWRHTRTTTSSCSVTWSWNSICLVNRCLNAVTQHLRAHHPSAITPSSRLPPRLAEAKYIVAAQTALARSQPSQCHRPHELEVMEKMRNEAREERWVEHWSSVEEEMVLHNFQRHLLREHRRCLASTNSKLTVEQPPADAPSNASLTSTAGPMILDEAFKDVYAVIADDQQNDTHASEPEASFSLALTGDELNMVFDPNDSSSKQAASIEDRSDRFYFALDEFWTAAMGKKSNSKPLPPVDLDAEKQLGAPSDCTTRTSEVEVAGNEEEEEEVEEDSAEEDVRCCLLCAYHGDNNIEGRLLFTGADTWVHVNCALWSNEVYEEETGQLIGLSDALRRSRVTACADCGRFGATMVCANAHEPTCTLYTPPWSPSSETDERDYSLSTDAFLQKAVHFACALRRRPPAPRSVFTADRSWFCSPECHQAATRQRLADAIRSLRTRKLYSRGKRMQKLINQDALSVLPEIPLSKDEYSLLENSVADDLEPISLGELLVCRRVFVPSDCFTASLYPLAFDYSLRKFRASPEDVPGVLEAARQAIKNLAVSPNSFAFVRCSGLIAANLVVTVGSLRVDRLGEVREASDALATSRTSSTTDFGSQSRRCNYLCPINYRARRIYWSCYKLDDRVSYTLHVKQTHAVASPIAAIPNDSVALHRLNVSRPTTLPPSSCNMCVSVTDTNPVTWQSSSTSATCVSVSVEPTVPAPPLTTSTNIVPVVAPVQQNDQPDSHVSSGLLDTLKPSQQKSPIISSNPPQNSVIKPPGTVPASGIPLVIHKIVSSGSETSITGTKNIVVNSVIHNPSPRILSTVSLSNPGDSRPGSTTTCRLQTLPLQPSSSSSSQASIRCTSLVPAVSCPTEMRRINPVFFHTRPSDTPKSVYAVVTVAKEVIQPARTCYPISFGSMRHFTVSTTNSTAIPIVSRPGGTYRIPLQVTPLPTHNPTTPTKDVQLANQLTGLFKSLPAVRSQPVQPNLASRATQLIREASMPTASRITVPQPWLPQLDGALDPDEDEDEDWRPEPKRSRSLARDLHSSQRQRSGSLTSNDSSASTTSVVSRSKVKRREVGLQQKRLCKQPALLVSPRRPLSAKRRWIEERNKQQELAHLVSKAKLANHARLYQHEVEKHARSFRLRFAIDGVVRTAPNPLCAWRTITARVAALRERKGIPRLINESTDGWTQFGLNHRHVIFLVEQMRGAFQCYRYRFRYHWRKVDELRRKFTPPIPVAEGCARAIMCTKPRLPASHARDPLSFLSCKANPSPRALLKPGQGVPPRRQNSIPTNLVSPPEPANLLSPNEQKACAEAARQAASLVAVQLKLPVRVREAYIAQAVAQVTGLPIKSPEVKARSLPCKSRSRPQDHLATDDGEGVDDNASTGNDSSSDEGDDEQEADLGTVTTQFKHMVSGPMARFLRVSVHPSRIHGRGLFALRGFREDEMVIEYMGELIRNLICEIREVRYRAAGVDCYMFRIDQDLVIDATYAGNAARFINHSCDPNCYAKVITMDDKKHIVILAQRRIYPGEELTYDYRFPKESDKLLCNCGSHNCRRYLN